MVFAVDITGLRVAEKSVVNVLDPLTYSSPIKIGKDGCARVCSQARRQRTIFQEGDNPAAKRIAIVIRHNEGIVQMAYTFGRTRKADDWFAC